MSAQRAPRSSVFCCGCLVRPRFRERLRAVSRETLRARGRSGVGGWHVEPSRGTARSRVAVVLGGLGLVGALLAVGEPRVAEGAWEWRLTEADTGGVSLYLVGRRPAPPLATISTRAVPNVASEDAPGRGAGLSARSVPNGRWDADGSASPSTVGGVGSSHPASDGGAPAPPGGSTVEGLLTFRGNPARTYYGNGPVPGQPGVRWRYPDQAMCAASFVGEEAREWCGTGWTGQPAVFERGGRTWLVFGAYDRNVHFVDADTGEAILPPFPTGDIIKGSVTIDPDGYPLVYTGSRDGAYRAIAFDGHEPREVWRLEADDTAPTLWNDDWDGAGLVRNGHLLIGGENSRFHVVRLNRGYDEQGDVTVDPEVVFDAAGWDDRLLADLGDRNVSIEGSVAVSGDTAFFSNSGGLVQGWDLGGVGELGTGGEVGEGGEPERTFRFWTGDDTDATVVVDEAGMLYVASEWERFTDRAAQVGQVMKLDPSAPDDPLVWSWHDPRAEAGTEAGAWATPALHEDVVIAPMGAGTVYALDRDDGEQLWSMELDGKTWASPAVVDGVLIQGDCSGALRGFDLTDPRRRPEQLWAVEVGGCIESTPAVWDGGLYVGTRAGYVHGIGDPEG